MNNEDKVQIALGLKKACKECGEVIRIPNSRSRLSCIQICKNCCNAIYSCQDCIAG